MGGAFLAVAESPVRNSRVGLVPSPCAFVACSMKINADGTRPSARILGYKRRTRAKPGNEAKSNLSLGQQSVRNKDGKGRGEKLTQGETQTCDLAKGLPCFCYRVTRQLSG